MPIEQQPINANYFTMEFPGVQTIWKEITGLGASMPIMSSYANNATGKRERMRIAGTLEYELVKCHAAASPDLGLDTWIQGVIQQGVEANLKTGTVNLYDASSAITASWTLVDAVITELSYGGWDVKSLSEGTGGYLAVDATFSVAKIERMQ